MVWRYWAKCASTAVEGDLSFAWEYSSVTLNRVDRKICRIEEVIGSLAEPAFTAPVFRIGSSS